MASSANGGVLGELEQNDNKTLTTSTSDVIPTIARLSRCKRFSFRSTTPGTLDDGDGDLRICCLATATRPSELSAFHCSEAVEKVLRDTIVSGKTVDLSAYGIIFACVGRITILYKGRPRDGQPLAIDTQGAPYFSAPNLLTSFATRFITETVANMDNVLPTKSTVSAHPLGDTQGSSTSDTLFVSCLNFGTLSTLASIEIVWVDTISAHLNFDMMNRKLFLFRFPSFGRLHATRNSVIAGVLESYQTTFFTVQKLMEETLVSYSLVFQLNTQAQLYRKEKSNPNNGLIDPLLDKLCLQGALEDKKSSWFGLLEPKKESFEASTEVPILSKRLLRFQKFIQGIPANRISSLWKDRRDMSRWYSIWAVIWIGGAGLILSVIQTSLAAESVRLTREQLQQGVAVSPTPAVQTLDHVSVK